MKRHILALAMCTAVFCAAGHTASAAQGDDNRGTMAIGLSAGNPGVSLELGAAITPHLQVRAGYSVLPSLSRHKSFEVGETEVSTEVGGQTYTEVVDLGNAGLDLAAKLNNFQLLLDFYPGKKSGFHITGGILVGQGNPASVTLDMSEPLSKVPAGYDKPKEFEIIDGKTVTMNSDNTIKADAVVANKVKPYLGIGFGRAVSSGAVSFTCDLGAMYAGKFSIQSYNNSKPVDLTDGIINDKDIQKIVNVLSPVTPFIKLSLWVKLF